MKQNKSRPPRHLLWKFLCLMLGLILTVMLAVTAGFRYFLGQIQYTAQAETLPEATVLSAPSNPVTPAESLKNFLDPRDVNWQQLGTDLTKKERDVVNILLIGEDRRENEATARSDSMILCTFNKTEGTLTMTSFLRDLYVPIPGRGSDRINAAYAYGGASLLKKTLVENFDITIDGAIEVDFSQFAGVIDTLGGVEITLRADEAEVVNKETGNTLTEGPQRLMGAEALAYARIRSLDQDGDFSRTSRQRTLLSALVASYKNAGFSTVLRLLQDILPMISTDMTESRLLLLAMELFPMLTDLQVTSQSIPSAGTYTDKTINGMAVLVADMDAARQLLHSTTGAH